MPEQYCDFDDLPLTTQLDAAGRRRLTGPALRAFFRIAEVWRLTTEQQIRLLGLEQPATLRRWRGGHISRIGRDTLERISYVLGIYRAIAILLPSPEQADRWIHTANSAPLFAGATAIARMTAGNVGDLYAVRQYLDTQLG